VVIKLPDWRRLVVPTNYFLNKSFQNWSRQEKNNLIGSIYLYADFTLPVHKTRAELTRILTQSSFWDGDVGDINVSDLKENVMQLKVSASARNPSDVDNLQNEIREKLIHYITQNHAACLPILRSYTVKNAGVEVFRERSSKKEIN
jgi:small-conductance mechanosensitive channel